MCVYQNETQAESEWVGGSKTSIKINYFHPFNRIDLIGDIFFLEAAVCFNILDAMSLFVWCSFDSFN